MRRLTTAWTDAHLWLIVGAAALVTLGSLATAGSHETSEVTVLTLAAVIGAFALASFSDAFGGLIVGLVAAALYTAMHQYLADARPVSFLTMALTITLLLAVGMASGVAADRIRRGRRLAARAGTQAVAPVEGSLGLVSTEDAAIILEDERARAELHQRPLSTAVVDVRITDFTLDIEDQRRARRAVARALETELRVTDVVFVDEEGRLGVILPETSVRAAVDVIEPALILARSATFADRGAGHRRPLADVALVLVEATEVVAPAEALPPPPTSVPTKAATRHGSAKRRRRPATERAKAS